MPVHLTPDSTVTFVLYAQSREQLRLQASQMLDDFEAGRSVLLMGALYYRPHQLLTEDCEGPGLLKFTITWIEL